MDIEKLIEQYRQAADKWEKRHPVTDTFDLRVQDALRDAATAIETLRTENVKLQYEAERQRRSADDMRHLCENAERAYTKAQDDLARVTEELNDLRAQWDMYGGDVGITETYKELERVTAERDAAISDLECETIGTPRACDCCKNRENSQCKRNLLYGWCKWEWRGIKKED